MAGSVVTTRPTRVTAMIAPPRLTGLTVRLRVDMLESRSPASSLLDLAALGLMAGDPSGLPTPPPPAAFVGLRPDLDPANGFDRPLTWAVPTDAGKMADTQSPTSFPSQSADRRGGLLEIDVAPERQPTFTLPQVASQPPASADDAAPVTQVRAVGAPAEPAAEVVAPALPEFLRLPAPRLPAKEDAPRSDPDIVPLPPTSTFCGGGQFKILASAQVKEVDFITDRVVVADPGRTPYPSQLGKPEWKDGNANGEVVDGDDEWAVPTWGVQGTKLKVKAEFKATWGNSPVDYTAGKIQIQGYWKGYGASLYFPAKDVTVSTVSTEGDTLSYPETESENTLPASVNITRSATIEWQVKIPGTNDFVPAGTSSNEMFVTLAPPAASTSFYHTVVSLSTRASTQATTPEQVVSLTYDVFRSLTIWTAMPAYRPANAPQINGKPAVTTQKLLNYWLNWNPDKATGFTTEDLLANSDGRCKAWADLMVDTLGVHGIGASRVGVIPIKAGEGYVIKRWEFGLPGSKYADYPYGNIRFAGGADPAVKYKENENDDWKWKYQWETTDVSHETGKDPDPLTGRGQGNTIPVARFADHALVRIGSENKLYDPSYGTGPFVGTDFNAALNDWENNSVAFFGRLTTAASKRMDGRYEDVMRGNKLGFLESKEQ